MDHENAGTPGVPLPMTPPMNPPATWKERAIAFVLSSLCFQLVYGFTGWYAGYIGTTACVAFRWEQGIPFLPWMMLPYMSSGIFFALAFALCTRHAELRNLTRRINFITIATGAAFLIFPLRYSFPKAQLEEAWLRPLFQLLEQWDTPYNQAPSLHVSYACVYWSLIRGKTRGIFKSAVAIWLLLMGISTLFVYQHHLVDVLSALPLAALAFLIFPATPAGIGKHRNTTIGGTYLSLSLITFLPALWLVLYQSALALLLLWVPLVLLLVGLAYARNNPRFLKSPDGSIPLLKQILYLPYMSVYRFLWCFFRNRQTVELLPGVFIGARLTRHEARQWLRQSPLCVIDLSAELADPIALRHNAATISCPLLDIGEANATTLQEILRQLPPPSMTGDRKTTLYIHCLMGYSRSCLLAALYLCQHCGLSYAQACTLIREKSPRAILPNDFTPPELN